MDTILYMTQFWKTTNEGSGSLNFLFFLLRIATMQAMANFLRDIMWFLIAYLPDSSSVGSVVDPDPHPDPRWSQVRVRLQKWEEKPRFLLFCNFFMTFYQWCGSGSGGSEYFLDLPDQSGFVPKCHGSTALTVGIWWTRFGLYRRSRSCGWRCRVAPPRYAWWCCSQRAGAAARGEGAERTPSPPSAQSARYPPGMRSTGTHLIASSLAHPDPYVFGPSGSISQRYLDSNC